MAEIRGASYYRARYYDPSSGRFLSEDPQRYEFTSFYSYVGDNPVLWQDPLGLWKCKNGDCGGLDPGFKHSLDQFEKCTGLNLTVTCGRVVIRQPSTRTASERAIRIFGGLRLISATILIRDSRCRFSKSVSIRASRKRTHRSELGGATLNPSGTRRILTAHRTLAPVGTTISNILEGPTVEKASNRILSIRMDTKRFGG